ncbi:MAG: hypothetical protein ABIZ50_02650, partial [Solirubrobacterales bacterium]
MVVVPAVAQAGAALSAGPNIPGQVTVGTTVPAAVSIINDSANIVLGEAGYDTDSFRIDDITVVPSCGSQAILADCPVGFRDPGVLIPSPLTAIGRAGTACGGRNFAISLIDAAQGKYRFTVSGANVVLGPRGASASAPPSARCIIDYTANVLRQPTIDSNPNPGLQTDQKASVATVDVGPTNTGQPATGTGTVATTVLAAP